MKHIYGTPNFTWWFGVVEDRKDPEKLGRCKVRIIGYHTEDTGILPSSDLPWALPMTPITSASTSGIGSIKHDCNPGNNWFKYGWFWRWVLRHNNWTYNGKVRDYLWRRCFIFLAF
jgi:hypothetical protein